MLKTELDKNLAVEAVFPETAVTVLWPPAQAV